MALTGFWVSGVCVASQADAIEALNAQYPLIEGGLMHYGSAVANGLTGATLSTSTIILSAPADVWMPHVSVINFLSCDPQTAPITLSKIFTVPPAADLTQAWMIAFTLPLLLWLTAWGFGVVVNMFNGKDDD